MTVINNLLRQIDNDPAPERVAIHEDQVDELVEYIVTSVYPPMSRKEASDTLRSGEVVLCGVPIKVLGSGNS